MVGRLLCHHLRCSHAHTTKNIKNTIFILVCFPQIIFVSLHIIVDEAIKNDIIFSRFRLLLLTHSVAGTGSSTLDMSTSSGPRSWPAESNMMEWWVRKIAQVPLVNV